MALRIDAKYARLQADLAAVRAKLVELQQLEQRIIGALLVLDELQNDTADDTGAEQLQPEPPQ